jgi:uncharacterized protein YabN with tetrapyrrole methylase and pyrophosphatase domain
MKTAPLNTLIALEKDARNFGFNWTDETMILEQVLSECQEIQEAIQLKESKTRIQEEIGDLIHTAISLCLFAGFDVHETLSNVNEKFEERMTRVKQLTHELGLNSLKGKNMDFMLDLWQQAKIDTKNKSS